MFTRFVLMVLAVFLMIFTACKSKPPATEKRTTTTSKSEPYTLSSLETDILNEVNRYRQSKGLQLLQSNSIIETEAAMHSQQMASRQVPFGHAGYNERVARIGKRLGGVSYSGENVAMGKMNAKTVVQNWLKSAPHKKNIEGNFNLTGIGVSRDNSGVIYYTQLFSLKSS
jgi:uncharacterized protein YkwD